MKKGFLKSVLATLILAIVCTSGMMAQRGQGKLAHNGERPSPTERAERITQKMTERLDLNDYQSDQVASLNLDLANEIKSLKESDMPREEKKAAAKELRDEYNSNIVEILTPEQNEKFLKWQEKRKGKRGGKGKGKGNCSGGHGSEGGNVPNRN